MKARIFSGSFFPGLFSTPEETSTPQGRRMAIDSATLSGRRPPAITIGQRRLISSRDGLLADQSKVRPVPPPESARKAYTVSGSHIIAQPSGFPLTIEIAAS